jgi:hypothetical protein
MKSFNLSFKSEKWIYDFYDADDLCEEAVKIILEPSSKIHSYKDLSAAQQPFFNRLKRLQRYRECPGVSIASNLLTHTGFETEPLHYITQPKLERKFGNRTVVSDAD